MKLIKILAKKEENEFRMDISEGKNNIVFISENLKYIIVKPLKRTVMFLIIINKMKKIMNEIITPEKAKKDKENSQI
jgi:hypothetical protein